MLRSCLDFLERFNTLLCTFCARSGVGLRHFPGLDVLLKVRKDDMYFFGDSGYSGYPSGNRQRPKSVKLILPLPSRSIRYIKASMSAFEI